MNRGIYTVANNKVVNQLAAFLNSIKRNWKDHPTVCVVPYDEHYTDVIELIKSYENVVFYDDVPALEQLDIFVGNLWMPLTSMVDAWKSKNKPIPHRLGMYRRFIGTTDRGLFDRFIYLDVDTYVFQPLDEFFELLDTYDIVAHDFQGTDPKHVFNLESLKLDSFLTGRLEDRVQCGGFIATKRNVFSNEEWRRVASLMVEDEEVFYPWAPIQSLWCYMFNKFQKKFVNLTRHWPQEKVTHDSQTYTKFVFEDGKLYEDGKMLYYFHHIGVPADSFNRICQGSEPKHPFRYRNVFEYYRFKQWQ